ncbi:MAG: HAD-IA family hydrolase [Myxococcaceae bacterium]|nr:HAD-IA family hydrolase [Myxococcaceae bacterium]
MPRSLRAISFDLYGTLLRYDDLDQSWRDWNAALHGHLKRHGLGLAEEEFSRVCQRFFHGNAARLEALSVFESRLLRMTERLGLTLPASELARIADDACQAWQQSISLDPECREVLEALAGRYALFLVSNFDHPRHVRRLLEEQGLTGFFQDILISGEHGVKKPDAAFFAPLRDRHAIAPSECAHVGDSLDDYQFALNTGMVPVMLGPERRINGSIDFLENEALTVSGAHHAERLRHIVEVISSLK